MATAPPTQPSPSAAAAAPSLPDAGGSAQRFPELLLKLRGHRNTDIRDGKCRIVYRSELDPRWTEPQVIDESVVIERNRLESLNLQRINPDVKERTHVKCICTRLLNLREDWYAHLYDGTIICNACARCFRCRTLCFTAAKKLNSIDGFVLCNTCMLSYGRYKEPKIKIRLQPLPKSLGDMETEAAKQQSTPVQESHMTTESIQANNANSSNGGRSRRRRRSNHRSLNRAAFSQRRPPPVASDPVPGPEKTQSQSAGLSIRAAALSGG
ncbi:hypothetical protein BOX15_Mlig026807g1 [Macrostomum lignano]|uniref:Uncharacterized protein n=1 Tax=Macrostomum lignano TaxID=282301 RepID=A0A267EZM5_9PLAT|nr:hypothetical protein BOX15_Mlig026807g1 [Macrostomum lignano]